MLPKKLTDFYNRFKIRVNEEEEFDRFRNRIYDIIHTHILSTLELSQNERLYGLLMGRPDLRAHILLELYIHDAKNLADLIRNLEALFAVFEENKDEHAAARLFEVVNYALSISPLIGVEVGKNECGIVFFPKGAEVLDPALIEDVLNWLSGYPNVNKSFMEALRLYFSREPNNYRNLLDNLRSALEELLRSILRNQKSLENQSKDLADWFQSHAINQQIMNLFGQLLFGPYRILQNDDVKHGVNQFTEAEVEFILYLSGTFMRLLIRVNQTGVAG
jgi:hypothetical protein